MSPLDFCYVSFPRYFLTNYIYYFFVCCRVDVPYTFHEGCFLFILEVVFGSWRLSSYLDIDCLYTYFYSFPPLQDRCVVRILSQFIYDDVMKCGTFEDGDVSLLVFRAVILPQLLYPDSGDPMVS